MPMMCGGGGLADGYGMEVGGCLGCKDVAYVTAGCGGGRWTALIGEHVLCKLLKGVVDDRVGGGGGSSSVGHLTYLGLVEAYWDVLLLRCLVTVVLWLWP